MGHREIEEEKDIELPPEVEKKVEEAVEQAEKDVEAMHAEGPEEEDQEKADGEEVDLVEMVLFHEQRIESMDRTLFFGLRGLVMLLDQVETVINPTTPPEDKAKALTQLQNTIGVMKETLK